MSDEQLNKIVDDINAIGLSGPEKKNFLHKLIAAILPDLALSSPEKKGFLQNIVASFWPDLPTFTTLEKPVVEEVQKATVGTGVVAYFKEHGRYNAVVAKAGTHYQSPRYEADPAKPTYMIFGGFANLTKTKGSTFVPADLPGKEKAEDPRAAAVRELEEELVNDKGTPVIPMDPKRLKPMDTKMLNFPWGEKRVVIGFGVELTPDEAKTVKTHVKRLEEDATYRRAARTHTINEDTGKPEVCTASILPIVEIVEGKHTLMHPDQKGLFELTLADASRGMSR